MKIRPKEPAVPSQEHETARRAIRSSIRRGRRSAKEISAEVGISEKEIYDHLEHIKRSLNKAVQRLIVTPAECRKCGFVFSKRERLRKPGKCPVCRGEAIQDPLFSMNDSGQE